jgi:hypothetical protein
MVGVVFACGRRFVKFDGEAAIRLKSGVEIYNANGDVIFYSEMEVHSLKLNGQLIERSSSDTSADVQRPDLRR